ncbi:MAG TPA: hypothetical protein VFC44_00770 [Candidatus Saccharimonadales bacterium]|nr:hypothetical protein [Candidatus Saccharimonadales bacterium]
MKKLIPALLLIGLCGCGPGYDYSPYVGAQQNWTTNPGSYVRMVDHVKIYPQGEYPERPYLILGSVRGGNEHDIAKAVRDQGGDAAMIFSDQTVRSGSVQIAGPGIIFNQPLRRTIVTAQVVKYR